MSWTIYLALLGWVPLNLLLFVLLPARRAALLHPVQALRYE